MSAQTKHFIIVEVETSEDVEPKQAEDMVLSWLNANGGADEFEFKSVGWIAVNVRPAPTGTQPVVSTETD